MLHTTIQNLVRVAGSAVLGVNSAELQGPRFPNDKHKSRSSRRSYEVCVQAGEQGMSFMHHSFDTRMNSVCCTLVLVQDPSSLGPAAAKPKQQ
jgi:hypothetical protein